VRRRELGRKAKASEKAEMAKGALEPVVQESVVALEKDLAQVLVEVDLAELLAEQAQEQEQAPPAVGLEQEAGEVEAREVELEQEPARARDLELDQEAQDREVAPDWNSDLALAVAREWDPAGPWAAATDPVWGPERGQGVVPEAEQDSDLAPPAGVGPARERAAAWVSRRMKTSTRSFTR
jgi:hypothetical protein